VIPQYQEPYTDEGIYGDFTYGSPGVSRGLMNAINVIQKNAFRYAGKLKILVIGAGSGYEIASFLSAGHKCVGMDLYIPDVPFMKEVCVQGDASDMPFRDKEFDLVFCTETFEHIPEHICYQILKETKRVGKNFYFTIATRGDGEYKMHINVHPAWWWLKTFEEHDLTIVHGEYAPLILVGYAGHGIIKLAYKDGVTIYGNCDIEGEAVSESV